MPKSPLSPTIDLTEEFRASSSISNDSQRSLASSNHDLEKGLPSSNSASETGEFGSDETSKSFLVEFENWMNLHSQVKMIISRMTKTTDSINKLHTQALMNNIPDSNQIDSLISSFDEDASSVRELLLKLKTSIPSRQSSHFILKFDHVQRSFLDSLGSYQTVLRHQRRKYLDYLERQCRIINPNISQTDVEQIQNALAPGQISGDPHLLLQTTTANLFSHALKMDAQKGLLLMEERLTEMQKLEASTQEISQIYNEIALIVARQGETIKKLHEHVRTTEEYTEGAKKETKSAIDKAKLRRKVWKWVIIIGIILLVGFLIYILFSALI